jgi:hypothetical protein
MFDFMNRDSRKKFVSFCCKGARCHGDNAQSKVFFNFIPGEPVGSDIFMWVRLGSDEMYVKTPESPSSVDYRVVETLK